MNSINNTNVVDFLNVMNSDVPRNEGSEDDSLAFAFNDSNISDRIIQLEVMNNLIEVHPNVEGCSIKDIEKDHGNIGDEATYANDGNHQMNCSEIVRVKTLHVISSILVAKSPFFYTLFSNEMMESEQKHVTLRIVASEEAPFIKLLNFMYTNSLIVFSPPILLDILMVADKFKVESCMRYCIRVLMNIPMTPETALLYLELPSSVLMVDFVLPLIDSAKQYLAHRYKDIIKHEQELMRFPVAGMEALLSSDDLLVASEDVVYDFVLKWAKTRYPKLEERREVLGMKLAHLIRFPFMSCRKLKTVQTSNDFDREVATQLVSDALYFKAEAPRRQQILAAESASTSRLFVERSYKFRPVKVVEFELPCQQCMVYLDLKQEECVNLFPCGRVYSVPFRLCGQRYFLKANCRMDQQSYYHCFGLFLGMQERSSSYEIDYEFAARSKPTEEYISRFKGSYVFTRGMVVGHKNLFATPWTSFMAEDSPFFINGILHLRVELTIRNSLN